MSYPKVHRLSTAFSASLTLLQLLAVGDRPIPIADGYNALGHNDGESDLDNDNTFAFEGNSEDDEQFGFGAGSGDDMIEGLIDDPELIGGLTDGHDIEDEDHQVDLDQLPASIFDPAALGLKEINNLARFRVSTYKPGNGVQELLSDDLDKYWQ